MEWVHTALRRGEGLVEQIYRFPADVMLLIIAYSSAVTFIAFMGWGRAVVKHKRAVRILAAREKERAKLQEKYDAEVEWRTAADHRRDLSENSPLV